MKFDVTEVRRCLKAFDFDTLFREHLGWDKHNAQLDIPVNEETVQLQAVAQKRGFVAFVCSSIPDRPTRLKIDHRVTKSAREHFVIYVDKQAGRQVWHWVRREPGRPLASRDHRFDVNQSGDPLIQRLDRIAVSLDEEEDITVVDVAGRARAAFDVDRVTKRFYDRFKSEHTTFMRFIRGIQADTDLQWYTSLMLNRLMFVYFIQKKGFLDGDTNYLRHRLASVQQVKGKDKFLSFYRYFLLRLFHEGLGKSRDERRLDPVMEKLLGNVPYLDGGFFEVHLLEDRYPDIDIPDEAFEKLFDFFDRYSWHLDERPLRADNEINPDVVGYIFEKYINQKQMGAYYTKEDITEYISKNTLIPFIFDAARKECAIAFAPDSALWRLLRDDPDRYIYPAVRHGVVRQDGAVVPESDLPDFVQKGMHDPKARMHDNRYNLQQAPADDPVRLVTETWREYIYRRTRCLEIREKLGNGGVHEINDLITLNLDIWQFARDAIINSEGPELLRAFWHAIEKVTVLDPTCGSGAFLFAALRILETLYSDCLERMERFVEDLADRPHHPEQYNDFKKVLARIADHPNERYFILKSIIINNLFGVDIMAEAVEICKLRLFLKLVAQVETADQIEPLPDIDFNIRTGNTLVGYATLDQLRKTVMAAVAEYLPGTPEVERQKKHLERIEEDAEMVDRAFRQFRAQQTTHGGKVTQKDKEELRQRLAKLDDELDRYLAREYGINVDDTRGFDAWKASHQPFHWFVEFYGIMQAGGFDVIIGNPPYIEYSKVRETYQLRGFATESAGNLYSMCSERSFGLIRATGRFGFIVQAPVISTRRMSVLREWLFAHSDYLACSSYDDRPSKLFNGMHHCRLAVLLARCNPAIDLGSVLVTRYHKWCDVERPQVFQSIAYCQVPLDMCCDYVPKIRSTIELEVLRRMHILPETVGDILARSDTPHRIYYKITGVGHWFTFTTRPPRFWRGEEEGSSTRESYACFSSAGIRDTVFCLLSSTLHYWFYQVRTNCRDFNPSDLQSIPIPAGLTSAFPGSPLANALAHRLEVTVDVVEATYRVGGTVRFERFVPRAARDEIVAIDSTLAEWYGLNPDESDFIINYDIKYRMGDVDGAAQDE